MAIQPDWPKGHPTKRNKGGNKPEPEVVKPRKAAPKKKKDAD